MDTMITPRSSSAVYTPQGGAERLRLFRDEDTIQERVRELGAILNKTHADKTPVFIGLLNGAFMFMADLMRTIDIPCEVDFWRLSSYGSKMTSSGHVDEISRYDSKIKGRHLIVVEDIVDTGRTTRFALDCLEWESPASITVVALLRSPNVLISDLTVDHVGFFTENQFIVGYGLDLRYRLRNLPALYYLERTTGANGQ